MKDRVLFTIIGVILGGLSVWAVTARSFSMPLGGMMTTGPQQITGSLTNTSMMGDMDRMFIQGMIPHHQSAIDMAKLALEKSKRPEIKNLANNIIKTQSEEISKMKAWYKNWYGTDVPDDTMGGSSMTGMMGRTTMDASIPADAADFDKEFLRQMTSHHQMAVMMAQMMLTGTNRPEMKQLGQNIIKAQTQEINQMQTWYTTWYQ